MSALVVCMVGVEHCCGNGPHHSLGLCVRYMWSREPSSLVTTSCIVDMFDAV
jgi:hypothetical protein